MAKRKKPQSTLRNRLARLKKKQKQRGPKKPLWKLSHGITFSALSRWLECREQFSLSYIDGLTPRGISVPLEFGSMFHLCLEHSTNHPSKSPEYIARFVCNAYRKFRQPSLRAKYQSDQLENLIALVEATFPPYHRYWQKENAKVDWVAPEEQFSVEYTLPNGKKINLRGKIDSLIRMNRHLAILETKTKSVIDTEDIKDALKGDMQTMIYLTAAMLKYKESPKYVLYNVIRRSKMYRRKDESFKDYINRIKADIEKRPGYYFMRWEVELAPNDIAEFRRKTLDPILMEFLQWYSTIKKNPISGRFDSTSHFQNFNALSTKYGRSDMYEAIHGNLRPYFTRKAVFPELSEESILESK